MTNTKSDFKVFVSDEILDFRRLEEKYNKNSPAQLQNVKPRKESHVVNERQLSSLETFAKTLFNSNPTLYQKYRRTKQKTRSNSVDPRFRRSRSPPHKPLTVSQSTTELSNSSMPRTQEKKKSHSTSYIYSATCNEQVPNDANKEQPIESPIGEPKHGDAPIEYKHVEKNNNPSLPTQLSSLDIDELGEDSVDSIHYSESAEDTQKKISPYWDDSRLLDKHMVMKPIRSKRIRSCVTVPILSKHQPERGVLVCRNCLTPQPTSPIYRYDDRTEIYDYSIINNSDDVKKIFATAEEYSPYMALGTVVGILLVSSVGWFISQNCTISLSQFIPDPFSASAPPLPEEESNYISQVSKTMSRVFHDICSNVYDLLIMPRSLLHELETETEDPTSWWPKIFD